MTRECKHENAEHLRRGDISPHGYRLPAMLAMNEQFRCLDCCAWLSLGPSNDDSEAVRVEIRAAEIAANEPTAMSRAASCAAECGYEDRHPAFAWSCGWDGLEIAWLAGYLARQIRMNEGP